MAREGRVPMARLYVQGVPAVRDLDVLVWNPDEGDARVRRTNPTLVVDRPPKGPTTSVVALGMAATVPSCSWSMGGVRFAIPGIDVDGRFAHVRR